MKRRDFLKTVSVATAATATAASTGGAAKARGERKYQGGKSPFPLCMNTSTIRPTPIVEKIEACAQAGFDALELWTQDIEQFRDAGNDVADLKKRIEDHGMYVIDTIGLWDGMPEDEAAFQKQMDVNKQRMELAARAGSRHIAVLPLPDRESFDLKRTAARYRHILEVGLNEIGIHPAMEFVSVFKGITRLGQVAQIAIDADHPKAMIIPDTFHLHNGGSGFNGIRHIQGHFIATFHWNDAQGEPAPGSMRDSDRIYPGEGILPLEQALRDLDAIGYTGPLSLELFRREHWEVDPKVVARNGLKAMRDQVERALA